MNLTALLSLTLVGCDQFDVQPDRPQDLPDASAEDSDTNVVITEDTCEGYWLDSSGMRGCIRFSEDTRFAGLASDHPHRGVSIYDFNQDGWDDVYLANSGASDELFLNHNGEFQQSESDYGFELSQNCHSLIPIDADMDGDEELVCISDARAFLYSGANGSYSRSSIFEFNMAARDGAVIGSSLMLASESGVFQYVFGQTGDVDEVVIHNSGCDASDLAVADYDLDGQDDFFVTCFTGNNRLYAQQSNDTFIDLTDDVSITEDGFLSSTQASWFSWDDQDFPMLSVSNYNGSDELYRRDADGEFISSAQSYGVTASGPVVSSEWLKPLDENSILLVKAQYEEPALTYLMVKNQPIELLPEVANQIGLRVDSSVMQTEVFDANQDGLEDIAFVSWDGSVKLFINESETSEN